MPASAREIVDGSALETPVIRALTATGAKVTLVDGAVA
jgi:hypothetical protein